MAKPLAPSIITKIQNLKKQGNTLEEIKKETGVSMPTLVKYTKTIKTEKQQSEIEAQKQQSAPTLETPQTTEPTTEDYDVEYLNPTVGPQEALIEVKGIPVNRKISLTPKNLLMWDCFRNEHPQWEGDLSNFINESMDCTFKSLKMKLKITIGDMLQ